MAKTFTLNSPQSQLADELRRRIASGEISGNMPGLRKLMADFGVTRTVVEGALAELLRTGDLKSRGASKAMEPVRRRTQAKDTRGTLLVFDRPPELRNGNHREIFLAVEAALPGPVTRLSLDSHDTPVAKTVRRILECHQPRVVIMDHRGEVADRLAAAGRIVVASSPASPPEQASLIGVGHEQLVRGAISRAFAAGHRRVSFVLWRRKPEVAAQMRAWIAEEYAKAGYRHAPEFDAPVVADRSPEALHACLGELLRHTPPTALVTSDFPQWLGTVTALARSGLRVPRDISLVCLCANPEWETATPTQAHFKYPVSGYAGAVRAALDAAAAGKPQRKIMLAAEWVPGESLGKPPAAQ